MSKTDPITYHYEIDGRDIAIRRHHMGTAYARNGNTGNPTQYYTWDCYVDGELLCAGERTRADAYETGRARVLGIDYFSPVRGPGRNVRTWWDVAADMKAHYQRRTHDDDASFGTDQQARRRQRLRQAPTPPATMTTAEADALVAEWHDTLEA